MYSNLQRKFICYFLHLLKCSVINSTFPLRLRELLIKSKNSRQCKSFYRWEEGGQSSPKSHSKYI